MKCEDKRCPIHGELGKRGFKFEGTVVSDRMSKSVVIERQFVKKIKKYERYEKRKTRITAHNPDCINAKYQDRVVIQECRPLSKTKNFVIIEKIED